MNFDEIKQQSEDLIRAGQRDQARKVLSKLKGKKVPRNRACEFTDLARRAGDLSLAFKIMSPILRPKTPLEVPPSPQEIACYALVLLGFGASLEALELLNGTDKNHSECLLAKSFCSMSRWDYESAEVHLKDFLKLGIDAPYKNMIAKVNLAAALVATSKTDEGRVLINEILKETLENNWSLLHKNAHEIGAQLAIQARDWDQAFAMLEKASLGSEKNFNSDDFFVKKWKAIAEIEKHGPCPKTLGELGKVQAEAHANGHWETIRDCDFHKAIALKDEQLFLQVYFGTPYQSYRDRIAKRCREWVAIPETSIRQMNALESTRIFKLSTGEEISGPAKLKPGKSLYNALSALVSDSYKPFVIGNLYAAVFPGEFFNPESSPRRISFLLHRLRDWFQENDLPLQIEFSKEGYRLKSDGPYAFELSELSQNKADLESPAHYLVMLEKLRTSWTGQQFTAAEVAVSLGISERSARYFIKWATENDQIERQGSGRSTAYKMAS